MRPNYSGVGNVENRVDFGGHSYGEHALRLGCLLRTGFEPLYTGCAGTLWQWQRQWAMDRGTACILRSNVFRLLCCVSAAEAARTNTGEIAL